MASAIRGTPIETATPSRSGPPLASDRGRVAVARGRVATGGKIAGSAADDRKVLAWLFMRSLQPAHFRTMPAGRYPFSRAIIRDAGFRMVSIRSGPVEMQPISTSVERSRKFR